MRLPLPADGAVLQRAVDGVHLVLGDLPLGLDGPGRGQQEVGELHGGQARHPRAGPPLRLAAAARTSHFERWNIMYIFTNPYILGNPSSVLAACPSRNAAVAATATANRANPILIRPCSVTYKWILLLLSGFVCFCPMQRCEVAFVSQVELGKIGRITE